jgi:hypothetical protein
LTVVLVAIRCPFDTGQKALSALDYIRKEIFDRGDEPGTTRCNISGVDSTHSCRGLGRAALTNTRGTKEMIEDVVTQVNNLGRRFNDRRTCVFQDILPN